jgi:DNA-binding MarR family transcriptional regulator
MKDTPTFDPVNGTTSQSERLHLEYKIFSMAKTFTQKEFEFLMEMIVLTEHGTNNNVYINQTELAKILNLTKQHLNTVITNLIKVKLLEKKGKYFTLKLNKLTLITPRKKKEQVKKIKVSLEGVK